MRSPGFICYALLASAVSSTGISEELEFIGSYWDDADSYRLTIDFEKSPARLEWDGYPSAQDGHQGDAIYREKAPPGKTVFGFDLTEEEKLVFKRLKEGLHLCHNGHQMVLGTGLSNTVRVWHEGKLLDRQFYFHVEPNAILGRRMSEVPIDFQKNVGNNGLSEHQRSEWIEKARELGADIEAWQEGINLLANAQTEGSEIPWSKLLAISQEAESSETLESFKRDLAFAYETEPVLDRLLSQQSREAYFPELGVGPVVVRIDGILKSDIDEWFSISPPQNLGHDSDLWKLAPSALLRLIEDFISADGGNISGLHQHDLLDLVEPKKGHKDDYLKRLEFIESSNWLTSLTGGKNESQSASQLRIFTITFEEKMSKCVVLTRNDDEARFTLLQVEDGNWKILRQIDAADWEEYGWKEPLFK